MSAHVRVPLSTCADKGATFAQWREAVLCMRLFFFPAQGKCKVLANVSGAPIFWASPVVALEDAADNSGPRYPDGSAS